jgi:putative solute:sodium symporter small subunit
LGKLLAYLISRFARSAPQITPRHAAERGRNGHELAARWEIPMLLNFLHAELHKTLLEAQNSPTWVRAKRLLLVMAGLWMSYFLLVNWFAHSLNKIAVPVIGVPLGVYLAVQGAAIVFAVALFRLARAAQ